MRIRSIENLIEQISKVITSSLVTRRFVVSSKRTINDFFKKKDSV